MTADNVFRFYRAYKSFYNTPSYDFFKYRGNIRVPPLINQPERRFYYRIAQRLNDAQIHALFTAGFFFQPRAYVTDLATDTALQTAVAFASRGENGRPLLEADLYTWEKRLKGQDIDAWLYGKTSAAGTRTAMPGCLQDTCVGELPLDLACLLLLIPQPALQYHWVEYWSQRPEIALGIGPGPWIERLKKCDRLLRVQRPGWRGLTHDLAKRFWQNLGHTTLAPQEIVSTATLFS